MSISIEPPQTETDERTSIERRTTETDIPRLVAALHRPDPAVHRRGTERLRVLIEALDDLA